ncbi:Fungalysin metallopeptidase-domain-containing protein, partial [Thamnocephalis sphaerospora]
QASARDVAHDFVQRQLGFTKDDYVVKNLYTARHTNVTHVYLRQIYQGLEIANGDLSLHIDSHNAVVGYSSSFFQKTKAEVARLGFHSATPSASDLARLVEAFCTLSRHIYRPADPSWLSVRPSGPQQYTLQGVPAPIQNVTAVRSWLHTNTGQLEPVWGFRLRVQRDHFHAHVSADGQRVLSVINWTKYSKYRAIKVGNNNPIDTPPELIVNPEDPVASPRGWNSQGLGWFFTTIGNNVYAQANPDGTDDWRDKYRPSGGFFLNFDFLLNLNLSPVENKDATITHLFYAVNVLHDKFYQHGFDEEAGNFQENNWGLGGLGNDAVIAHALDGSCPDEHSFTTLPDGENPIMRLGIPTESPFRDGALDNSIITHEYSHGVTGRLVGGPSNTDCLDSGESGGLAEGWSDFFAGAMELGPNDASAKRYIMGRYVENGGIRIYPYSTDMSVNPTTYGYLQQATWRKDVHNAGEVWANMLFEVFWRLVDKLGFAADERSADITKGNVLAIRLVMEGLRYTPCRPTFLEARNALLEAERQVTHGAHACDIWRAFAKRGLGWQAR